MLRFRPLHLLAVSALAASVASVASCSSSDTEGTGGGHQGPPGGPLSGAADTHCGATVQPTDPAACMGGTGGAGQGGGAGEGGAADDDDDEYGATLFNTEGDDDECKYHVKIATTPIYENEDVTLTVTLTNKTDGSPATSAETAAELFLNETHPAPNSNQSVEETAPGVYRIGPVRFDAPGRWTARFHFYEDCVDGETSPHGHAAFFLDVP
jgi:hypothetical protein